MKSKIEPLKTGSDYICTINDNAEILSDSQEETLQETLEQFMETTGVPVAFYTDFNDTWRSNSPSLVAYSLDLYNNNFSDEYHWVIIYTQAENDSSNWYWEGMQGDYTDKVLDVFIDKFNKNTQKQLEKSNSDIAAVFADSFEIAIDKFANQHIKINFTNLYYDFFALFFILCAVNMIILFLKAPKPKRLPCKKNKLIEVTGTIDEKNTTACEFCGKYYVAGLHQKCPYCKADLNAVKETEI